MVAIRNMTLSLIAIGFLLLISIGYFSYGRRIAKIFGLSDATPTPAHTFKDDVEYVPTKPFYLFAQHFSAIAASGPIAGPILACQKWGWLPSLLWISVGVIFIGAVHDFATLALSIRHGATSMAEIMKQRVSKRSGVLLLVFIWVALIYIIIAFTQVTAATFVSVSEELSAADVSFNPGGAVAASALYYLLLCLALGIINRIFNPPLWATTIVFVPATFAVIWLGTLTSTWLVFEQSTFELGILVYCAIAALLPVWLLLQPRGYLGGFVLFFVLAIGVFGLLSGQYDVKQPMFINDVTSNTPLFPFLFVTIACGACSGFHGLVCGGTTSKQIDRESHAGPIGYGAMLLEGLVAVIALATIMIFAPSEIKGLKPGTIYGMGIGEFLTLIIGDQYRAFATTLGAMAFSTFVFDTLDVATRLGRYLIEELFGLKSAFNKYLALLLTLCIPVIVSFEAPPNSWLHFWTLFGSANQLLAALSLLAITVWLSESKKPVWFTLIPMLFVLITTLYSLLSIISLEVVAKEHSLMGMVNAGAAGVLVSTALYIVLAALKRRFGSRIDRVTLGVHGKVS